MEAINFYKNTCVAFLRSKIKNERGASLVEYALLVALIAVVALVVITGLGNSAATKLGQASSALQ